MEYIFRRWKFFMNHCESTRACNFSLMKLLWLLFSNCFLSKWIVIIIMFWSICSLKISSSFLLVFSNLFITRIFLGSVGRFKAFSKRRALIIIHCFALTMFALSLMLVWIFMFASWRKPDLALIQWPSAHYLAFYFDLAKPLNEFSSIERLLDISKIKKK